MNTLPTTNEDDFAPVSLIAFPFLERVNRAIYSLWGIPYPEISEPGSAPEASHAVAVFQEPKEDAIAHPSKPTVKTVNNPSNPREIVLTETAILPCQKSVEISRLKHIKRSKPKMSQKSGRRKGKY